jgi:hypothetical protein
MDENLIPQSLQNLNNTQKRCGPCWTTLRVASNNAMTINKPTTAFASLQNLTNISKNNQVNLHSLSKTNNFKVGRATTLGFWILRRNLSISTTRENQEFIPTTDSAQME